jgi:hypothetical protein
VVGGQIVDPESGERADGEVQTLGTGTQQMGSAQNRVDRASGRERLDVFERVDHPGMPAAEHHHQSRRGVDDERLIVGQSVDLGARGVAIEGAAGVLDGLAARDLAAELDAGPDLDRPGLGDELPHARSQCLRIRDRRADRAPITVELGRQRLGMQIEIDRTAGALDHRLQSAGVVVMAVAECDRRHPFERDSEPRGIVPQRQPLPGVEQQTVLIGLDEEGRTMLTEQAR